MKHVLGKGCYFLGIGLKLDGIRINVPSLKPDIDTYWYIRHKHECLLCLCSLDINWLTTDWTGCSVIERGDLLLTRGKVLYEDDPGFSTFV